jgi:hypothetical protein
MPIDYPSDLPITDAKLLFDMATGRVEKDLKMALHSGWTLQGYLQGMIFPPGDYTTSDVEVEVDTAAVDDEQAVAALGFLCEDETARGAFEAQGLLSGISGRVAYLVVAKMLLPVLFRWLKEWAEGEGLDELIEKMKDK